MGNKNLRSARTEKNDEFYTQLSTIEQEVMHYREHFKGKVVYLNCDDPRESNFFHYFSYNFERLGLKKLIASCYKSQDYNLFSLHDTSEKAVWLEYTGEKDGGRIPTAEAIGIHNFKGDGDFRSEESIELLKQVDIVVTNPPFSLFREYIAQLVEHKKKFLIIGSTNAITYKEIFPQIKESKLWQGVNIGAFSFTIPESNSSNKYELVNGEKTVKFGNIAWWTNLEYPRRSQDIIIFREYKDNEVDYPKYDNYDAINIDKVADIPKDYKGHMGVPISFIGKHSPEQFEIIGLGAGQLYRDINGEGLNARFVKDYYDNGGTGSYAEGRPILSYYDKDGLPVIPYMRILIQNKYLNPEIYAKDDEESEAYSPVKDKEVDSDE